MGLGDPSTVKLAGGSGPWLPVQPDYAGADPLAEPGGIPAPNVEDCGLFLTNAPDETLSGASCYTANVTNAYQGDPMKIRFGHAGIYETPCVPPARPHLVGRARRQRSGRIDPAQADPVGTAAGDHVDLQTYSPWTAFTADLNYGAGPASAPSAT